MSSRAAGGSSGAAMATPSEFIAEEGDIFNIPTGIFRGFENVGTDYGMIMAILGGDDAGGGVTWAPQVIEEARAHGLVLGNNGVLYDTKQGQELPHNVQPMPTLTEKQMKDFPETPVEAVVPRYVARYWDLMALSGRQPAKVIGTDALLKDKPGFEVDFLSRNSLDDSTITPEKHVVLMPMRGHWALRVGDFDTVLNPGDTCLLKPGEAYSLAPSMTGEASLYRVTETDDPVGATWSSAA